MGSMPEAHKQFLLGFKRGDLSSGRHAGRLRAVGVASEISAALATERVRATYRRREALHSPSGLMGIPIKVSEESTGIAVRRKELRPGNGGASRHHGSDRQIIELRNDTGDMVDAVLRLPHEPAGAEFWRRHR